MSGLMDKAKDAMGKGGDSSQSGAQSGGSGMDKSADNAVNKGMSCYLMLSSANVYP